MPCFVWGTRPIISDGQAFRQWRSIRPSHGRYPYRSATRIGGSPWWGPLSPTFEHFRYADGRSLAFSAGEPFADIFDAVIGADVAEQLGYRIGDRIILNHGTKDIGLTEHADKPFKVRGILKRTGSPVDRSVHVSLEAIEAIHLDWQGGAPMPGLSIPAEYVRKFDLAPKEITAVLIGLKSRAGVFQVQRFVNHYKGEPLLAVLPGVALDELWSIVGIVEKSLLIISALVVAVGLSGLAAVVLAGLGERRRELAVLRSVGAGPRVVFMLLAIEGLIIVVAGSLLGVLGLVALSYFAAPFLEAHLGISLSAGLVSAEALELLAARHGNRFSGQPRTRLPRLPDISGRWLNTKIIKVYNKGRL